MQLFLVDCFFWNFFTMILVTELRLGLTWGNFSPRFPKKRLKVSDCFFNAKWAIFSHFVARASYFQWNDNDVLFVLDHTLTCTFIVLAHWQASTLNSMVTERVVSVLAPCFLRRGSMVTKRVVSVFCMWVIFFS
jgi:hypothetical protein